MPGCQYLADIHRHHAGKKVITAPSHPPLLSLQKQAQDKPTIKATSHLG